MKIELTHDIIAQKIWEQLPEQDKIFKSIIKSVSQRQLDYKLRNGSLLSEKEYNEWKTFFDKGQWSEENKRFIDLSNEAIILEQQEKEQRFLEKQKILEKKNRFKNWVIFFSIISIVALSAFAAYIYIQKEKNRKQSFNTNLIKSDRMKVQGRYQDAILELTYNEQYVNSTSEKELLKNKQDSLRFLKELWKKFDTYQYDISKYPKALEIIKQMNSYNHDEFIGGNLKAINTRIEKEYTNYLKEAKKNETRASAGSGSKASLEQAIDHYENAYHLKPNDKLLAKIKQLKKK